MVLISWLPVSKEQGETLPMIVPSNPSSKCAIWGDPFCSAVTWGQNGEEGDDWPEFSQRTDPGHDHAQFRKVVPAAGADRTWESRFFVSLHTQSFHTYHVWSCLIIADHFLSFLFLMCSYVFFFYVFFDFLSFVSIFCPPRCRRCK